MLDFVSREDPTTASAIFGSFRRAFPSRQHGKGNMAPKKKRPSQAKEKNTKKTKTILSFFDKTDGSRDCNNNSNPSRNREIGKTQDGCCRSWIPEEASEEADANLETIAKDRPQTQNVDSACAGQTERPGCSTSTVAEMEQDSGHDKTQNVDSARAGQTERPGCSTSSVAEMEQDSGHDKESTKSKYTYKFQESWLKGRTWLRYDKKAKKMYCDVCIKFASGSSIFKKGCSSFRLSNIVYHETICDYHTKATEKMEISQVPTSQRPLEKAVLRMEAAEFEKMKVIFRTAFYLAKKGRPYTDLSSIMELQRINGAPKAGETYNNDKQARLFVHYIYEDMRRQLCKKVQSSDWIALLSDSATDRGTIEEEVVHVRYLNENAEPVTEFVALKSLHAGDAATITAALIEVLEKDLELTEESWKKKLAAVCMDGAPVNMGCKSGVATRLKEKAPCILSIHCCSHRLELVVKDILQEVAYFEVVESTLLSVYKFYHNSPLNWAQLLEAGEAFGIEVLKPKRASGTRWLPHHDRAVAAIVRNYPALVQHLGEVASEASGERKLKAAGLYKEVKSLKFVTFLNFLRVYIPLLANLSKLFQTNDTTVEMVVIKTQALTKTLMKLLTDNDKLLSIVKKDLVITEDENGVEHAEWFGTPLSLGRRQRGAASTVADQLKEILKNAKIVLDTTIGRIGERFDSFVSHPVVNAARVFDMSNWPDYDDDDDTEDFGAVQIGAIYHHYKQVLDPKGFSFQEALIEWTELQILVNRRYPRRNKAFSALWPSVIRTQQESARFANIFMIIRLLLAFPVNTAECERAFSLMNTIKTDWRNKLTSSSLTSQMKINTSSTTLQVFDPTESISLWWKGGKRRPKTKPYGPRKKKKKAFVDTSSSESEDSE